MANALPLAEVIRMTEVLQHQGVRRRIATVTDPRATEQALADVDLYIQFQTSILHYLKQLQHAKT